MLTLVALLFRAESMTSSDWRRAGKSAEYDEAGANTGADALIAVEAVVAVSVAPPTDDRQPSCRL